MKRAILAVLLIAATTTLSATPEDFFNTVDFSISMADLVEMVDTYQDHLIDPERYLILEGSVASTMLIDPNPETYYAIVELVAGEWQGLEAIRVHRVYVELVGPEFAGRVVERLPRDPGPEIILSNSDLMVVAAYVGATDQLNGIWTPVVTAVALR